MIDHSQKLVHLHTWLLYGIQGEERIVLEFERHTSLLRHCIPWAIFTEHTIFEIGPIVKRVKVYFSHRRAIILQTVIEVCPYEDLNNLEKDLDILENYRDKNFVVTIKVQKMDTNVNDSISTRQSSYGNGDGDRVKDNDVSDTSNMCGDNREGDVSKNKSVSKNDTASASTASAPTHEQDNGVSTGPRDDNDNIDRNGGGYL